jgi:hypothetical protein
MKKLFTLIAIASVPFLVSAQTNKAIKISDKYVLEAQKPNASLTEHESYAPVAVQQKINKRRYPDNFVSTIGSTTKIGETTYDTQTNASVGSRLKVYADGKITATWTFSSAATTAFADRGTGYNHFNGTAWGGFPSARIESERTGWPALANDGTKEMVFAHAGATPNGRKSVNASIGATSFTTSPALQNAASMIWHRAASSGQNVYVMNSPTAPDDATVDPATGIVGPNRWSRSTDGGATWVEENSTTKFPGYDSTNYNDGGADEYSVITRGNVVAVAMMSVGRDVAFWKSTDNGATFTRTVIEAFPIPSWFPYNQSTDTNADNVDDTLSTVGTFGLGIDASNNVHVVWSEVFVLDDDTSANTMRIPLGNAIFHWSEADQTKRTIGSMPDLDGDGQLTIGTNYASNGGRYANVGVCSQPQVAFGDAGEIMAFFIAPTENDTTDATLSPMSGQNYNDIWAVSSADNGATWSNPLNVSNPDGSLVSFEDCVPSVYPEAVGGSIHMIWMSDAEPGITLDTNNPDAVGTNDIVYLAIPKTELLGIGNNTGKLQGINIKSYPNPSNGNVTFQLDLAKSMKVEVSVSNLLGQRVMDITNETFASGNHTFTRDLSSLPNGIYFYTVSSNGKNITEKLVISK